MGGGARFSPRTTSTTNKRGGEEVKGGVVRGTAAGETNISSQEIVRGHLYFITMISSLHLPRAALFFFLDCSGFNHPPSFLPKKLAHLDAATQPNDATGREKALLEGKKQRDGGRRKKENNNDDDKQNNMEAASTNAITPRGPSAESTADKINTLDVELFLSKATQHMIGQLKLK